MNRKNQNILSIASAIILVLLLILSQAYVVKRAKSIPASIMTSLESATIQSAVLYNSLMFSMLNAGIQLDGIQSIASESDGKFIQINKNETYFVIFVPLSEDICNSCVDYAINSVREFFDDFSESDRFILLAQGRNPVLRSRVYNKQIYHDIPDTLALNLINNPENKPFYFVLNDNMEASMFFIPNALMPELTDKYLDIILKKHFANRVSVTLNNNKILDLK